MIKILKPLAIMAMFLMLLSGCVASTAKGLQPESKHMSVGEIRNETSSLVVLIRCVEPAARPGECIGTQNVVLLPMWMVKRYEKENGKKSPYDYIHKLTLEYGDYIFHIVARDVQTGQELIRTVRLTVDGPKGKLLFKDPGTPVIDKGGEIDV